MAETDLLTGVIGAGLSEVRKYDGTCPLPL